MNPAHLHLLVNHLPIIGLLFSIIVLGYGIFYKNLSIIGLGQKLLVLCGAFSIAASTSGESAEHYLKGLKAIETAYLSKHSQAAEVANIAMIVVAMLSLTNIFVKKIRNIVYAPLIILVLSIITFGLMAWTSKLGGEIMHKEIRVDSAKG